MWKQVVIKKLYYTHIYNKIVNVIIPCSCNQSIQVNAVPFISQYLKSVYEVFLVFSYQVLHLQ